MVRTLTHNKRNRLDTATVGALGYAYTYNALEQLGIRQQTAGPSPFLTHFVHDIFGNVIAETAGGGATGATGTVGSLRGQSPISAISLSFDAFCEDR